MKYYTIEAGVVAQFITVDVATGEQDITLYELDQPKSFNEDWLVGHKKCECCDDVVSTFFLGEHIICGRLSKMYLAVDQHELSVSETAQANQ